MRFLVTGGSGFLGINLIRYLLERGHEVRSLDLVEFDYADCRDRVDAGTLATLLLPRSTTTRLYPSAR